MILRIFLTRVFRLVCCSVVFIPVALLANAELTDVGATAANLDTVKTVDLSSRSDLIVKVPYMERASFHRLYADALLKLALELTIDEFGPYIIIRENVDKAIRRQLLELEKGDSLSVAISMPTSAWLQKTSVVEFPILKGLASYRMFFSLRELESQYSAISNINDLKKIPIGQGLGWSTGIVLKDNGFNVVYGGLYSALIPMLKLGRFNLLMRSVYEMNPELVANVSIVPNLTVVEGIAAYTYLPMYFFVSKKQPELRRRIDLGLKKAHQTGLLDHLHQSYFGDAIRLLVKKERKIFYLKNTNIDASYHARDKPYLLDTIRALGEQSPY